MTYGYSTMDIVKDVLQQVATGDNLTRISQAAGGDAQGVQSALGMGLPAIVGSLATTAAQPGGTGTISGMMAQAAGNNPVDNLGGFLANPASAGGAAMV